MTMLEIIQSLPPGYKVYHRGSNLFEIRKRLRQVATVYGLDGLEFLVSAMSRQKGAIHA